MLHLTTSYSSSHRKVHTTDISSVQLGADARQRTSVLLWWLCSSNHAVWHCLDCFDWPPVSWCSCHRRYRHPTATASHQGSHGCVGCTAAHNATNSAGHVILRTVHLDSARLSGCCSHDLFPSVHRRAHGRLDLGGGINCRLLLLRTRLHAVQSCCERAGCAPQRWSKVGKRSHGADSGKSKGVSV